MNKIEKPLVYAFAILLTVIVTACGGSGSGGGGGSNPAGTLSLNIVDGTSTANRQAGIADANVVLLDGAGDPINNFTSDSGGAVPAPELAPGSYQLKVSAQGFNPSPAPRVPPLPVAIIDGETTVITIELFPLSTAARGAISGTVKDLSNNAVAGALVIAEVATESITTISAANGSYILHNVDEGSADLTAFISGLNFPTLAAVSVTVDATTTDQNIVAESEATGSISGQLNFVAGAINNEATDVTLIDLVTREVIPGMRVLSDSSDNYTMSGLPDGEFEIIASLENDGNVIDPDESVTQGDPLVVVTAGVVTPLTRDFKITGAVEVGIPATPVDNVVPELSATPTFTWHSASAYASLNDYAIEVVNESGDTVWGGFGHANPVEGTPTVTVAKGDNTDTDGNITLVYNVDASGETLKVGRVYQLRIYALSNVTPSASYPNGFKLLSVTENLNGIFKVVE